MSFYVHDYDRLAGNLSADIEKSTRIFVVCAWETVVPDTEFLNQLTQRPNPITLVLNTWTKHIPIPDRFDTFYIDFFLWRTYNEVVNKKVSDINTQWNKNSNKFLFLTGKPRRPNRAPLLYRLEFAGLTDRAVTSLVINDHNRDSVKKLCKISDAEFDRFEKKFNGSPDNIPFPKKEFPTYGGIPYDVNLFSCKFRLISESTVDCAPAWITEKTWLTILNKMPFIIAGDVGSCDKLKNLKYSTFDQFLKFPYDNIQRWPNREWAIVENVKHWLDADYDFEPDVMHNYNRLCQQAQENLSNWNRYCKSTGLSLEIDQVIDTSYR